MTADEEQLGHISPSSNGAFAEEQPLPPRRH